MLALILEFILSMQLQKGINTIAIEPDSLNNAMLNLNINANSFGDKIIAFALAFHEEKKYSTLKYKKTWLGRGTKFIW